jgi:hypothetical protein
MFPSSPLFPNPRRPGSAPTAVARRPNSRHPPLPTSLRHVPVGYLIRSPAMHTFLRRAHHSHTSAPVARHLAARTHRSIGCRRSGSRIPARSVDKPHPDNVAAPTGHSSRMLPCTPNPRSPPPIIFPARTLAITAMTATIGLDRPDTLPFTHPICRAAFCPLTNNRPPCPPPVSRFHRPCSFPVRLVVDS